MFIRLLFFCSFIFISSCSKNEFNEKIKLINQDLDFKDHYQLISFNEKPYILIGEDEQGNKIKIRKYEFTNSQNILDKINQIVLLYNSQFKFNSAPYPGQLTLELDCGTTKKPLKIQEKEISFFRYFANNRLFLSTCDRDEISFFQYLLFFKINKSTLVSIDLYMKREIKTYEIYERFKTLNLEHKIIKF